MFNVTFNSLDIPSFVKVKAVDFAVLPSISHNFKQAVGGRGLLEAGTLIGGKILKLNIIIVPTAGKSLTDMSREFAQWLQGDSFKLCPLVISDEASMTYQAKINSSVDISDLIYIGEGDLEFIVPSGVAQNTTRNITVTPNGSILTFINNGTAPSRPVIKWTPSATLTGVTQQFICSETGRKVEIAGNFTAGVQITIDCENKVAKRGLVVEMTMVNFATEWIVIPNRGVFTVVGTYAGTYSATALEYWL